MLDEEDKDEISALPPCLMHSSSLSDASAKLHEKIMQVYDAKQAPRLTKLVKFMSAVKRHPGTTAENHRKRKKWWHSTASELVKGQIKAVMKEIKKVADNAKMERCSLHKIPSGWTPLTWADKEPYHLAPIDKSSYEYMQVIGLLGRGPMGYVVTKIQRVQNIALWNKYVNKRHEIRENKEKSLQPWPFAKVRDDIRAELRKKGHSESDISKAMKRMCVVERFDSLLGSRRKINNKDARVVIDKSVKDANNIYIPEIKRRKGKAAAFLDIGDGEQYVFHGTGVETFDAILRQGFDMRLAGSNVGTAYGEGNYFGSSSMVSLGYSRPDPASGKKYVFLCIAFVGTSCMGRGGMRRPVMKCDGKFSVPYDSAKDPGQKVSEYVLFDNAQAYPAYVIEFTTARSGSGDGGLSFGSPTGGIFGGVMGFGPPNAGSGGGGLSFGSSAAGNTIGGGTVFGPPGAGFSLGGSLNFGSSTAGTSGGGTVFGPPGAGTFGGGTVFRPPGAGNGGGG